MLQSVLKGKAQTAYTALSAAETADYDTVKKAILKAYELVPEASRQKFRNHRKQDSQTYVEFAHEELVFFERWCTSRKVGTDFDRLKEIILIEQFKRRVSEDIKTYLDEKDAKTLSEAAILADEYALTHKRKFNSSSSSTNSSHKKEHSTPGNSKQPKPISTGSAKPSADTTSPSVGKGSLKCAYCKKPGHLMSECYTLKNKRQREVVYF